MALVLAHITTDPREAREMVRAHVEFNRAVLEVGGTLLPLKPSHNTGSERLDWKVRNIRADVPDNAVALLEGKSRAVAGFDFTARTQRGVRILALKCRYGT